MESIIHADIFFFVTTAVVLVLGVLFIIALAYAIKVFRDISDLTSVLKEEGSAIASDVRELRGSLKREGVRFGSLLLGLFAKKMRRKKKKSESEEE